MSNRGSKFGDFLTGIVLGGFVGYVAALLSAPKTGDETRQMLQEQSRQIRDRAMNTVQTTIDKTGKLVAENRNRVGSTLETTMSQARDRASDIQDLGTEKVTGVREQVSDKLRTVADSIDPNTNTNTGSDGPSVQI